MNPFRFYLFCLFCGVLLGCQVDANISELASQQSSIANCVEDTILTGDCKATSNQIVTTTFGSSVSSWSNPGGTTSVTATIPDAYYQGKMCSLTDPTLVATNIRNGTSIFGVVGSLVEKFANCAEGSLNVAACSTAAGRYVSGVLGTGVNGSNGSLTATIPAGYYDGSVVATMSDANLTAGNIKSGVAIFGVTGSYVGSFQSSMISLQHRSQGTSQITLLTEAVSNAGVAYTNSSSAYRAVPDINKDDEGSIASGTSSVTGVNRTGWGATSCGTTQATIAARIADCAANAIIGPQATWDGAAKGNAGQGVWKLVSRTGNASGIGAREVWQDLRTGLLWSSLVANSINWCKATGSNNITNNPAAQADPINYCSNATYQNTGAATAAPNTGVKAISACFEDANGYFTSTDVSISNAGKAGLNLTSTPTVAWRLPTIYDYKQADIDGFRMVLADVGNSEWASTISAYSRVSAWIYTSDDGQTTVDARLANYAVRCVGR